MIAQSFLGKNLFGAINANGCAAAVELCNARAIDLTDRMVGVLEASIKRVSDLPRNPLNLANADELAYIKQLKVKLENIEKRNPFSWNWQQGCGVLSYHDQCQVYAVPWYS
ncbi:MAG: MinD superfamily P-loop ATPase [Litorivivens sp.]|jgi:MinD superfamily P-loop ATPase